MCKFAPSKNALVRWCNGSTADFGSACSGSNPDRTTRQYTDPAMVAGFVILRKPGVNWEDFLFDLEDFFHIKVISSVLQIPPLGDT